MPRMHETLLQTLEGIVGLLHVRVELIGWDPPRYQVRRTLLRSGRAPLAAVDAQARNGGCAGPQWFVAQR
jgi:hypothetical protein